MQKQQVLAKNVTSLRRPDLLAKKPINGRPTVVHRLVSVPDIDLSHTVSGMYRCGEAGSPFQTKIFSHNLSCETVYRNPSPLPLVLRTILVHNVFLVPQAWLNPLKIDAREVIWELMSCPWKHRRFLECPGMNLQKRYGQGRCWKPEETMIP